MSDNSNLNEENEKKKRGLPIVALTVAVVAAAALVCLFLAWKGGLFRIPLNGQKQTASADAGKVRGDKSEDTDDGGKTVNQKIRHLSQDYTSYAKGVGQADPTTQVKKTITGYDDEDESEDEGDLYDEEEETADYVFPESSDKSIPTGEIEELSNEDLRMAINEIYARHGYCFPSNQEVRNYFDAKDWYTADPDIDDMKKVRLSKTEKKNVDKMSAERQKRIENGDYPY